MIILKLLTFLTVLNANVDHRSTLAIVVGNQRSIKASGPAVVTNSKILKVSQTGSSVSLFGTKPGEATLKVGRNIWEITVLKSDLKQALTDANSWNQNTPGGKLTFKPDRIFLAGEPLNVNDWLAGTSLINKHKPYLVNQMAVGEQLKSSLKKALIKEFQQRAITSAKVDTCGNQICVYSSSVDKSETKAINEVAGRFGVEVQEKATGFDLKPMVEIEVLLVEVRTNSALKMGIKLPGQYSATILPSGDLSTWTTTFGSLTPELNLDQENQNGRVLANPKLICRSGDTASFLAGGEIPIKVMNWKLSDVVWKKYGIILNFTPVTDGDQLISTKVTTEVSLLDESHKVDGIPGLLTNRIDTHFNLKGSKTIALSGLLKTEVGRNTSGTPLLSQIPILGELFKSRDYRDRKTELVVLVTPRIIDPESVPQLPQLPLLEE